jgi:hypothetical protein
MSPLYPAGVTTRDANAFAASRIKYFGAKSAFLGYRKYPCQICISVNEQVVHGLAGPRVLRFGDNTNSFFGRAASRHKFSHGSVSAKLKHFWQILIFSRMCSTASPKANKSLCGREKEIKNQPLRGFWANSWESHKFLACTGRLAVKLI